MIKGVNKCIIEVNAAGSKYFEKALIFVRPEYAALSQSRLQTDAKDFLSELEREETAAAPGYRRVALGRHRAKKRKLRRWVTAALCIVGVVAYSILIRSI